MHFNQSLIDENNDKLLPKQLEYLQLSHRYNQLFVNSNNICILPFSIKTLYFKLYMDHERIDQYDEFTKKLQKTNFGKRQELDETDIIVYSSVRNKKYHGNDMVFTFPQ
jgi:hypothetical protein